MFRSAIEPECSEEARVTKVPKTRLKDDNHESSCFVFCDFGAAPCLRFDVAA
jgi:hypothetical protein